LILFDDILTADEITKTSTKTKKRTESLLRYFIFLELPIIKKSLSELIRRQQTGRPLEDSEPIPLIERKQGHWSGILNVLLNILIYIYLKVYHYLMIN